MSTRNKFALGALVGAVAGIIAGVLTAPKSGKETRTSIKDKALELKQKSVKKAKDAKDKADKYHERSEHAIKGAVEGAKEGFKAEK
jgi:gas vesicle protein